MATHLDRLKRQAKTYVEQELYDGTNVETEVVGMTETDTGKRVGVAATPVSSGLLGSISSAFTGTTYYYATVTIDSTGTVALSNKDLSRADFYDRIDRAKEADLSQKQRENRQRFWEDKRQEAIEDVLDDRLSLDDTSSVPERCPRCKESGDFFRDQFEHLGNDRFQCRNENCGHIVDLS